MLAVVHVTKVGNVKIQQSAHSFCLSSGKAANWLPYTYKVHPSLPCTTASCRVEIPQQRPDKDKRNECLMCTMPLVCDSCFPDFDTFGKHQTLFTSKVRYIQVHLVERGVWWHPSYFSACCTQTRRTTKQKPARVPGTHGQLQETENRVRDNKLFSFLGVEQDIPCPSWWNHITLHTEMNPLPW